MKNVALLRVACAIIFAIAAGTGSAFAGPDRSGVAIGFAHVKSDGTLLSSGGSGVKSASSTRNDVGDYTVTFNGHFPKTITKNSLIVTSTAQSAVSAVSNAEAIGTPSATQFKVEVFTFDPTNTGSEDNNCYVAVFFGR